MSFCSVFFNVKKNPSPLFIVTVNKRRPHGEKSMNYISRCGFANKKLLHVPLQMICVFHIQFVIVIESPDSLEKYESFQKKKILPGCLGIFSLCNMANLI